ncbi:carbon-nitrogen hydrolase family protein [Synechococcus sp. CS-1329]|uniref:carbon-nitrogen hydrolase family protein n=1 Tax=Synechococcus sp. CS-1329 TaxID=2847975 RepID=UPI00223C267E|nr:carbon-nitrogen hydrolase family protein [Synechococcus sp. CS-1329]MCT0217394.1 carbon-nitrogen hydrolase family protein [Synechococcus sp. CS-1329]
MEPSLVAIDSIDPLIRSAVRRQPPAWGQGVRLGLWQGAGAAGTPEALVENLERLESVAACAASHQVQLLAFPELYLSGYALGAEAAWRLAEAPNGPSLERVAATARRHGLAIACPYPERAVVAGRECLYDAIALFDQGGQLLRNYRKTHLWGPDEALLWTAGYREAEEGPAYTVQEVNGFPLGLLNCYEGEFPELTRLLVLAGARLVLIPTAADAWMLLSDGRRTDRPYPDVSRTLLPAHAFSNQCFVAYANRCGEESVDGQVRGAYLGNSVVAAPDGTLLLAASDEPTLLIADCRPGDYGPSHPEGTTYLSDRRTDLYGALAQPQAL